MCTTATSPRTRAFQVTGSVFLLLAMAANRFLHPGGAFDEGLVDGLKGVLFGVAIGAMLVSVARQSRMR